MGVTGLWKLIEPCGKPVPVETLEGKILAVDISIWLHQAVKGFQDSKGSALNNAHLLGLFHRLCKLLYYRVRPVFIFDGCVPQLKRDTIARRQQQRNKLSNEADRIQALLLQSLAKEKVVQQALGSNAELLLKSPLKFPPSKSNKKDDDDDLFKLPDLPTVESAQVNNEDESELSFSQDDYTTSDSSFDESSARHAYNANLQTIDVRSKHFLSLPADVRHEILTDIKETRKQSSWGRLHELPARSDDFCSFQMKRLLKRRAVQESLEKAEEEMGGHTLTYSELCNFFNEEGIVTPTAIEQSTRQISSDEHTRFLLVRDLKKKSKECVKQETIKELPESDVEEIADDKPSTSAQSVAAKSEEKKMGAEYDADLALALALSLEETKVYDERDYDYDSDKDLKLNRDQSKQLRHAAKGPARAYMIEYGGMNEEEVENIMEATQVNDTLNIERLLSVSQNMPVEEVDKENEEESKISKNEVGNIKKEKVISIEVNDESKNEIGDIEKEKVISIVVNDESDTDSDLEEVIDKSTTNFNRNAGMEICVDLKEKYMPDNDLFGDIFEEEKSEQQPEVIDLKDSQDLAGSSDASVIEEKKNIETTIVVKDNIPANPALNIGENIKEDDDQCKTTKSKELSIKNNVSKDVLNSILTDLKKQTEDVGKLQLTPSKEFRKSVPSDSDSELDKVKSIKVDKQSVDLNSILEDLKRQTSEIKNLKLESIKISDNTPIELSSDDEFVPTVQKTNEIIELCESDDNQEMSGSISKTPSKHKSINDYFETSYVIKRTPDKKVENDITPPTTPKVPKPFFVKRTPKSGQKRAADEHSDESNSPAKKTSKAAKMLFESQPDETEPEHKQLTQSELIIEAAETLKSQSTNEELHTMANDLAKERRQLEAERNRQDRMGMSINQRMSFDCQELLRLFGIPYIVAPMEAEAQCAFLNAIDLTHGTITDDSDIWLFGGRTVYKNFFAQNKHVLEFRSEKIEETFNCNRNKLIQLACLVGSDYTTGIHGIGAVTALEILASFSSIAGSTSETATSSCMQSVLSTLVKFRDWWQAHKHSSLPPGSSARLSLRKKLKNIELHDGFPSTAVVEAYLTPKVDDSRDAFSWGLPDVESIREFARKTFGWTTSKTDDILMPVMKKINEKKVQNSILNYFTAKSALRVQQPSVSKRVQKAIDTMSGKADADNQEKPKRAPRTKRSKATTSQTEEEALISANNDEETASKPTRTRRVKRKVTNSEELKDDGILQTAASATDVSKPRKCARIPNTKEIIPQRERDIQLMHQNRAKAAEVLKKASAQTGSK